MTTVSKWSSQLGDMQTIDQQLGPKSISSSKLFGKKGTLNLRISVTALTHKAEPSYAFACTVYPDLSEVCQSEDWRKCQNMQKQTTRSLKGAFFL